MFSPTASSQSAPSAVEADVAVVDETVPVVFVAVVNVVVDVVVDAVTDVVETVVVEDVMRRQYCSV